MNAKATMPSTGLREISRERAGRPANSGAISGTNGQLMVIAAHRYCLGRQSYIVGACIEWLRAWWSCFDENTKNVIIRDTIGALQDDAAGSDYDAADWKFFAEWAWDQMSATGRSWCESALAYKNKPWPLSVKGEHEQIESGSGDSSPGKGKRRLAPDAKVRA